MNTQNELPVAPHMRTKGWLNHKDRVVVITFEDRIPIIKTGHVCSWPGSHGIGMEVDNINETVVWGDEPWNNLAIVDNADDAHEKTFTPRNNHLFLKIEEAVQLCNVEQATLWFEGKDENEILLIVTAVINANLHRQHATLPD